MFYDVLTSVINIFTVQLYFIYIQPTTVAQGAKMPSERLFFRAGNVASNVGANLRILMFLLFFIACVPFTRAHSFTSPLTQNALQEG